ANGRTLVSKALCPDILITITSLRALRTALTSSAYPAAVDRSRRDRIRHVAMNLRRRRLSDIPLNRFATARAGEPAPAVPNDHHPRCRRLSAFYTSYVKGT